MSEYQYSPIELKLREACERGLKIGRQYRPESDGISRSPTGEHYQEFCIRSDLYGYVASSAEDCYLLALGAFIQYAQNRLGDTLYWRVYPEIKQQSKNQWGYYMRLLIDRSV